MSSLVTLVSLCSCLHPYLGMLGFVSVVDLLLGCMCLRTEEECALFEAETDSHDSCLTVLVDCAQMVDMFPHQECGRPHTCGR